MPNAGMGDCSSARAAHNCFGHFCLAWTVFRVPRHPHVTRRTPTESNLSRLTRDLLRNEQESVARTQYLSSGVTPV